MNIEDDVKKRVSIFKETGVLVFVKRFSGVGNVEYINGHIVEIGADFFLMTDVKQPDFPPKLVFYLDFEKEGAFITQSKIKEDENEM